MACGLAGQAPGILLEWRAGGGYGNITTVTGRRNGVIGQTQVSSHIMVPLPGSDT